MSRFEPLKRKHEEWLVSEPGKTGKPKMGNADRSAAREADRLSGAVRAVTLLPEWGYERFGPG